MTKEAALLNASRIHSLMVQFGSLDPIQFFVWNIGNECKVSVHYDPLVVNLSDLENIFRLHAIEGAYIGDSEIENFPNHVFVVTWHWDD